MSKKDDLKNLKDKARAIGSYMNQQVREAVAYVPDAEKVASVSVSKWIEMPKPIQDAIGLPGLPIGNISCVFGKPDTGKTTFLMEAIAACQRQNILPILILTEHKFDFTRLSKYMGADPEALLVLHANNLEQGYAFLEKVLRDLKGGKLSFEDPEGKDVAIDITSQDVYIMWDSIGNTLSETEMEYEVEEWDKSMGKPAKAIRTLTKRINHLLSKVRQRVGILFLNQSYQSMPNFGPSVETPYGGEGVPYSSVLVLRFRRKGDLKMKLKGTDTVIGLETIIEVKKNHITHKRRISTCFVVAKGFIAPDKESLEAFKKTIKEK